jgi:hypothetical protein
MKEIRISGNRQRETDHTGTTDASRTFMRHLVGATPRSRGRIVGL